MVMSSIATAVFKATIGLLVKKGRDKAANKLKGGDVTDQKFRGLIVREIDEIKSKLDGLSRKDLLASISFFKEGIELLYEVFDKVRSRSGVETSQASFAESFSLVKGVKNLDLANLNDSATRAFANAKERFRDARRKATEAFSNEALETSDRILAMQYRVMATILETVDNPEDAVVPCRVCIEELHCLSAVQECFSVELTKGFRARFGKDERRKIICNVCHVNFVIYDVTLMICFGNKELSNWPCIGSGGYAVDPLRDRRVTKVLRKQGMEHCCVTPWSFGQEDEEEHKLKIPQGIATNSSGQFIVADSKHNEVKLFDSCGIFWDHFSPTDDEGTTLNVLDVATDINDYIYVLVELNDFGCEHLVYKFKSNADLYHKFPVRGGHWYRVTVTGSGKVLVLGRPTGVEPSAEKERGDKKAPSSRSALRARVLRSAFSSGKSPVPQASIPEESDAVDVYEMDGQFVCSLGERKLKDARDITTANYGRVMVVDRKDSCVHMFTEDGEHLNTFKLQGCYSFPKIAFHRASEHVVVAGIEQEKNILHVEIYTRDGEFIRSTEIHEEGIDYLQGMTVTIEGRIAVVFRVLDENYKILVV